MNRIILDGIPSTCSIMEWLQNNNLPTISKMGDFQQFVFTGDLHQVIYVSDQDMELLRTDDIINLHSPIPDWKRMGGVFPRTWICIYKDTKAYYLSIEYVKNIY